MNNTDTICAVSTPAGVGCVAMIRVSGSDAFELVDKIWQGKRLTSVQSHTAHLGYVMDNTDDCDERLDQAVCTVFRTPNSFTGENVVEISVHGSRYVQQRLLEVLVNNGCRMAEPGEFTRRAFVNGRLDLAQAEAVADVISSTTRASHRIAMSQMRGAYSHRIDELRDSLLELCTLLELELDFSEEDVEFASRGRLLELANNLSAELSKLTASFSKGNAVKNGVPVSIIGQTNAGKSTLLNALVGDERAIVSDIHGTTRDFIEDTVNIDGVLFRLIDTAGLRDTDDRIEAIGIERSLRCAEKAMIILWILDCESQNPLDDYSCRAVSEIMKRESECCVLPVLNKTDVASSERIQDIRTQLEEFGNGRLHASVEISAKTGKGVDRLTEQLKSLSGIALVDAEDILVSNVRHYESLKQATASINRTVEALNSGLPGDLIAQDLRETINHLSSITGKITTADILQNIFTRFCIGK